MFISNEKTPKRKNASKSLDTLTVTILKEREARHIVGGTGGISNGLATWTIVLS